MRQVERADLDRDGAEAERLLATRRADLLPGILARELLDQREQGETSNR